MNHEPFERLLLGDAPLTLHEQEELRRHLVDCQACSALSRRWGRIESVLASSRMLGPQPGFVSRFVAGDQAAGIRRERRQAWRLFGATSMAASTLAALLAFALWQGSGNLPVIVADVFQQGLRWWIWADRRSRSAVASSHRLRRDRRRLRRLWVACRVGPIRILGSFGVIRFSFQEFE
jgi:hypothetical protein